MNEMYDELAKAVVMQAAMDYVTYRWKAKHAKTAQARNYAVYEVRKLEQFFYSERFLLFTDVNREDFIRAIKRIEPRPAKRGKGSNRYVAKERERDGDL